MIFVFAAIRVAYLLGRQIPLGYKGCSGPDIFSFISGSSTGRVSMISQTVEYALRAIVTIAAFQNSSDA